MKACVPGCLGGCPCAGGTGDGGNPVFERSPAMFLSAMGVQKAPHGSLLEKEVAMKIKTAKVPNKEAQDITATSLC